MPHVFFVYILPREFKLFIVGDLLDDLVQVLRSLAVELRKVLVDHPAVRAIHPDRFDGRCYHDRFDRVPVIGICHDNAQDVVFKTKGDDPILLHEPERHAADDKRDLRHILR
ncbi:MAG: hypothetical protein A4E64_00238 [Syntrophorhabdus sp. PtaU1.Bin058]|nr:MAG: hypothetical protein A4E64_00238 [Syntrophorhabdus sp. PtaU1.Bin058]